MSLQDVCMLVVLNTIRLTDVTARRVHVSGAKHYHIRLTDVTARRVHVSGVKHYHIRLSDVTARRT